MAGTDVLNELYSKGETLERVAMVMAVFQFAWILAGYFVRSYFVSMRKDISKLFELMEKKDMDCKQHEGRIGYLEGQLNGGRKR